MEKNFRKQLERFVNSLQDYCRKSEEVVAELEEHILEKRKKRQKTLDVLWFLYYLATITN